MHHWTILRLEEGLDQDLWYWAHHVDGVDTRSRKGFVSRAECVEDAKKHGYNSKVSGWVEREA